MITTASDALSSASGPGSARWYAITDMPMQAAEPAWGP